MRGKSCSRQISVFAQPPAGVQLRAHAKAVQGYSSKANKEITMSNIRSSLPGRSAIALAAVLLMSSSFALAADTKVKLSGADEVPAVQTAATGTGTITVGADKSISGSVTTKDVTGVAAHIHQAAVGKNGPPIITLEKTADGVWSVPKGAKLTDEQLAAYKAGELYVNVHSAANKGGEIRGQLKP
jgi:hypothetical protein